MILDFQGQILESKTPKEVMIYFKKIQVLKFRTSDMKEKVQLWQKSYRGKQKQPHELESSQRSHMISYYIVQILESKPSKQAMIRTNKIQVLNFRPIEMREKVMLWQKSCRSKQEQPHVPKSSQRPHIKSDFQVQILESKPRKQVII